MKKHQLGFTTAAEVGVIGVVSQLPDYRLAHFLSKHCGIHLMKYPDLSYANDVKGSTANYPFFASSPDDYGVECSCIANKSREIVLLVPVLKQIDYFLVFQNLHDRFDLQELVAAGRSIPGVQMIQALDQAKIPRLDELLSWIELHMHKTNESGNPS
jgi:hypothetical protein